MVSRRKQPTPKSTPTKPGVLRPSQRFIHAKSGKLSKTNLQKLFTDPEVWASLTKNQQGSVLESIRARAFFGAGHPEQVDSNTYTNYFTTFNPAAPRMAPDQANEGDDVKPAKEVYFDMSNHLEIFREHLEDGRFDPRWMKSAQEIGMQRARGDYDDFWQFEYETALGDESRKKVDAVKVKRVERIKKGLE